MYFLDPPATCPPSRPFSKGLSGVSCGPSMCSWHQFCTLPPARVCCLSTPGSCKGETYNLGATYTKPLLPTCSSTPWSCKENRDSWVKERKNLDATNTKPSLRLGVIIFICWALKSILKGSVRTYWKLKSIIRTHILDLPKFFKVTSWLGQKMESIPYLLSKPWGGNLACPIF